MYCGDSTGELVVPRDPVDSGDRITYRDQRPHDLMGSSGPRRSGDFMRCGNSAGDKVTLWLAAARCAPSVAEPTGAGDTVDFGGPMP